MPKNDFSGLIETNFGKPWSFQDLASVVGDGSKLNPTFSVLRFQSVPYYPGYKALPCTDDFASILVYLYRASWSTQQIKVSTYFSSCRKLLPIRFQLAVLYGASTEKSDDGLDMCILTFAIESWMMEGVSPWIEVYWARSKMPSTDDGGTFDDVCLARECSSSKVVFIFMFLLYL